MKDKVGIPVKMTKASGIDSTCHYLYPVPCLPYVSQKRWAHQPQGSSEVKPSGEEPEED